MWWKCAKKILTLNKYFFVFYHLPTPKNKGQTKTAVVGLKHCSKIGSIHDLKENSSESGATICALSHSKSRKLFIQCEGSETSLLQNQQLISVR